MSDNLRFSPVRLQMREGETVKLVVRNTGRVLHELVLGTRKELEEHAALMAKFPGMEHEEPHMAHVAAGKVGEIVWNFNRPGISTSPASFRVNSMPAWSGRSRS